MSNDTLIYDHDGVSITPSIAKFGGVSYSVQNINSVFVLEKASGAIWWIYATAGLFALFGFGSVSKHVVAGIVLLLVAGVLILLASKIEPSHVLVLKTSSGDQQAYTTKNSAIAVKLKASLEAAMTAPRN